MVDRYSMKVCKNGDIITSARELSADNSKYCEDCGASVIDTCLQCNGLIPGSYKNMTSSGPQNPPKFCNRCGKSYPWTTKKEMLGKVNEFVQDSNLDSNEKLEIKEKIDKLAINNLSEKDQESLAERLKTHSRKLGEKTYSEVKEIMIEVMSRAAARVLMGDQ